MCQATPCTALVVVATALFSHWQDNRWAQAAIHGAIAAAVAVITCWTIAHPHFKARARFRVVLVAATASLLHAWLAVPTVILLSASSLDFLTNGAGAAAETGQAQEHYRR